MTVGLLLITHYDLGASLLETATKMLNACPLLTKTLPVAENSDPELLEAEARKMLQDLNRGQGVLVLTDLYGSTPANIASRLQDRRTAAVSGINLPMLVRVLNYPQLDLEALIEKALSGGRDGVIACRNPSLGPRRDS